MDPAGLAVGITSLAFDLFDNSVKLFKFFSAIVDMPKEYEQYRLQLMIEYNRLLAWGDAIGLIDVPQASHVATNLGTNAIELCGIISRIGWLLGEFRDMNARWESELTQTQEYSQVVGDKDESSMDIVKQVSSLATAYEKNKSTRQQAKGVTHIRKWMSRKAENAKEIVTNPLRVRWVMMDKAAFKGLLEDLHFLTNRMHELTVDHRQSRIQEITAKTYREMVVARNSINELKTLLEAVTELLNIKKRNTEWEARNDNTEMLRDILRLKEINSISNQLVTRAHSGGYLDIEREIKDLIDVQRYDNLTASQILTYLKDEDMKEATVPLRPRGVLQQNGTAVQIWIEWKVFDNQDETIRLESKLRTMTLAQMLHMDKPRHLYSPLCVGYVDESETNHRIGWIFKMAHGASANTTLRSLHSMLGQCQYKPVLTQRISLAWRLASSLSYMHTTNWLHKGIHSGNVSFSFEEEQFDAESPILSGFEYSRPQSNRTTTRSLEPKWDIYRWPQTQNEVPKTTNSRKTYDIYSLGLVLLEIAHWKPLNEMMCLKKWPIPSAQDVKVRGWLLGEDARPPFKKSNPLSELRDIVGDKYWNATRRCLVAHGELGLGVEENFDKAKGLEYDLQLQNNFTDLVVEELKSIMI
ncbi:uncharacterized protein FMAN_15273 [Fusarium mangiferae]|uniref:Protein kinase domain-containing protein n=1 Tax=Fusarium mangiferae TaxID=192010 RepID=A0A1L7U8S1_FUSMA|nr:uncharacterized protein FMAN_15273 [Fusarium mangiferae]CVL07120.1 uncharacterized protein FMAN_15273 [Fusarium mangiferae]